jgi:hypothetical protein
MPGLVQSSIECRASLCRLELEFDGGEALDRGVSDAMALASWDTDGYFHLAEGNARRLVIYLTRQGTALPVLVTGSHSAS